MRFLQRQVVDIIVKSENEPATSRESGGIMAYDASDEELIKNDRRERSRWSDGPVR